MTEIVNEIRSGWARLRPDFPTRSVGAISLTWRLAALLRAERASVLAGLGADQATLQLLAAIRRDPGTEPLTPGVLADRCGVTPGAISLRLRRSDEAGWTERVPSPSDGRSVTVRLTPSGIRAADELAGRVLAHDDDLVALLTDGELAELERLLGRWVTALGARRA